MTSKIGASILFETTVGDFTVDLFTEDCPRACENLLKLCKIKYFNRCPFHFIQKNFIVQTGKVGETGGNSVWGVIQNRPNTFFEDELRNQRRKVNRLHHDRMGLLCMANLDRPNTNGSQFYITSSDRHLDYLDDKHSIFGQVSEGLDTIQAINDTYTDNEGNPLKAIRINHTHILEDPFPDPKGLNRLFRRSPTPSEFYKEEDGEISSSGSDVEDMDEELWQERLAQRKKESQEKLLQMLGDIPEDMAPPDNVLFVCRLNSVTQDQDLELIFSRFGRINSCEIIRDKPTGDSLCYGFIEFETREACENAYKKMENVLIDDRRIHVDFSQSVAKLWRKFARNKRGLPGEPSGPEEVPLMARVGDKTKLRYKNIERAPGHNFVIDDSSAMQKAYDMIDKAKREDKKSKRQTETGTQPGGRNRYGDEQWSDDEAKQPSRKRSTFISSFRAPTAGGGGGTSSHRPSTSSGATPRPRTMTDSRR